MNDKISDTIDLKQTDEDILIYEVSDEALEAAAEMEIPSTKRTSTCGLGCPCK